MKDIAGADDEMTPRGAAAGGAWTVWAQKSELGMRHSAKLARAHKRTKLDASRLAGGRYISGMSRLKRGAGRLPMTGAAGMWDFATAPPAGPFGGRCIGMGRAPDGAGTGIGRLMSKGYG